MITERIDEFGMSIPAAWSVALKPSVPTSILRRLDIETAGFCRVAVLPARWPDLTPDIATLVANATFVGVLRDRPDPLTLAGPGMAVWVEDEDGKGQLIEDGMAPFAGSTWKQLIEGLIPDALIEGAVEAISGGPYDFTFAWEGRRDALRLIARMRDAEIRVNPDGTLDAGTQTNLYPSTASPTVIVVDDPTGGREPNIVGIPAAEFRYAQDLDDYTTRVRLNPNATDTGVANATTPSPYKDPQGNTLPMAKFVTDGTATTFGGGTAGDPDDVAQGLVDDLATVRRQLEITTNVYNLPASVRAGDSVYVWQPVYGLFDTANALPYRGDVVYPMLLRVPGVTWPVEDGMDVWAIFTDDTTLCLTEQVDWDQPGATLEIGALPRAS